MVQTYYSSVPNRRVRRNKRAGGKILVVVVGLFSSFFRHNLHTFCIRCIIVQVILIFETVKVIVKFILTCLLSYLSQI